MQSKHILATLSLVPLGLAASGAAFGQDMEEIIVTARKVGESIQEVPLSISAFTSEDIEEQGIINIEDIVAFTPGLHMSNTFGDRTDPALKFRGMDNATTSRQEQLASAFVDGIYLSGSSQWVSMNDMERVEVVKGPQSAFFGRATFGGAVNYITKTPGDQFAADASLTAGQDGRMDAGGSVEGSIVADRLYYRLSGRIFSYDGGWDNEHPDSDALGAQETNAFSLTLYATPSDTVAVKFRSLWSNDDDGLGVRYMQLPSENNCGPWGGGRSNFYCGTLSRDGLPNQSIDTTVDLSIAGANWPKDSFGLEREVNLNSLEVTAELGDYTLSSLTGYVSDEMERMRVFVPAQLLDYAAWKDTSFSQELRLNSSQDGTLRWMLGAYYLDLTYGDRSGGFGCASPTFRSCRFFFGGRTNRGAFGVNPSPDQMVTNTALFGSVSYDVTEQLTLGLEVRRAEEDLDNGEVMQVGGSETTLADTFSSTTPRVILDYQLYENTMVFASYSEGNTAGGFNTEIAQMAPSAAQAFQEANGVSIQVPEGKLENWELGVKHTFANGRGFVNAGFFTSDWTNQRFQTFVPEVDVTGDGMFDAMDRARGGNGVLDGTQIDYSGSGNTEIYGSELSLGYALTEMWSVQFAYNYNRTKIKKYEESAFAATFGFRDAADGELALSPRNSATLSLAFSMPAGNGGEWFGRLDSSYQDSTFTWVHNLAKTQSEVIGNLRGGWRNECYTIMAWVENVTDSDAVLAARRFTSFQPRGYGFALTLPDPRQVGVTLQARFGES
ncbi:MAG: TonB-dependent receptor [Gammaproteobacteria bacterium]|nr:TonB-dependent receptor [Gammaproteobacteria bacterium]MCY4340758.1 TonB-dependent receptor [Gammaproteobacteria bacterium]